MWLGSMIRDPEDLALMLSMALGLAPASVHLIPFFFPLLSIWRRDSLNG